MHDMTQTPDIHAASQIILSGGVLAYPTESVWGLGCDPFNETAFEQLLTLKNRPQEKGVILIAGDVSQVASHLSHLPGDMQQRMQASWVDQAQSQQGVTWLVPLAENTTIPTWITGQHDSVALRVTPHPLVQALCESVGSFLVSTSCNPAGEAPAMTVQQAKAYFDNTINYLDGETLGFDKPSCIIDAKTGAILR